MVIQVLNRISDYLTPPEVVSIKLQIRILWQVSQPQILANIIRLLKDFGLASWHLTSAASVSLMTSTENAAIKTITSR